MQLKAMTWINGWACNQLEPVETNAQVRDFGLEPAGCVKMIQTMFEKGVVMKERVCYAMYCNNTVVYE
jgi:hypothetical protein